MKSVENSASGHSENQVKRAGEMGLIRWMGQKCFNIKARNSKHSEPLSLSLILLGCPFRNVFSYLVF